MPPAEKKGSQKEGKKGQTSAVKEERFPRGEENRGVGLCCRVTAGRMELNEGSTKDSILLVFLMTFLGEGLFFTVPYLPTGTLPP